MFYSNFLQILIGYCNGTVVLWNLRTSSAELFFSTQQNLEFVSWQRDGSQFVTAHIDGSYAVWASNNSTTPKEQPTAPYGDYDNYFVNCNNLCTNNAPLKNALFWLTQSALCF